MKRLLSLLLCLSLIGGALLCLASCQKKADVDFSAGYRVVYEKGFNDTLLNCVKSFEDGLEESLGVTFDKMVSDGGEATELEVLVGDTDRPESAALKKKIEGDGYAFGVRKGKLVLVGTSKLYTVMALNAFAALCAEAEGSTVTVPDTVSSQMNTVHLNEEYALTYSSNVDETASEGEGTVDHEENPDCLSYDVVAAKQLRDSLRKLLNAKSTSMPYDDDRKETYPKEVLIGLVDREATADFIKRLDADSYGISVTAKKVAVTGMNEVGLRAAVMAMNDIIDAATTKEDGKTVILLPEGFSLVLNINHKWVLDFPRPTGEGVTLQGTVDAESNHLLFNYSGDKAAYLAYCQQLESAGYELLQANEVAGSIYRTYRTEKIRLQVSFAAFAHAKDQNVKDFTPGIRIVSGAEGERGTEFDDSYLTEDLSYNKVTETRLTAVYLNYYLKNDNSIYGNCYVMQLEDGSFIVQDGGHNNGGAENRLYNVLADLHKQATGLAPSASNPIVIAAWYLTHGHGDHYPTFTAMCKKYGTKIRVESLISNFPSDEMFYSFPKANMTIRNDMSVVTGYTQGEMQYIKVHTGQRIFVRNVEIEILFTPEDLYPVMPEQYNDTCTVARFIVHNTDGKGNKQGKPTSILWMGDAQPDTTRCMRAMWGDTLKSDAVQVAHHGGGDSERYFYPVVQPELVLWPCATKRMSGRVNDNSNTSHWKYSIYNLYRMESVKYHVISDLYNTTITITKDGFVMSLEGENALYNAGEDAKIVIGGLTDHDCAVIRK
ncbi:MAG: hypothetical protein E7644_05865 [Ruminococcaceae bacterium]|nr:hypothetical protein [Oscillospiraceae bacterium]